MLFWCGHARLLTTQNGGFQPGQETDGSGCSHYMPTMDSDNVCKIEGDVKAMASGRSAARAAVAARLVAAFDVFGRIEDCLLDNMPRNTLGRRLVVARKDTSTFIVLYPPRAARAWPAVGRRARASCRCCLPAGAGHRRFGPLGPICAHTKAP